MHMYIYIYAYVYMYIYVTYKHVYIQYMHCNMIYIYIYMYYIPVSETNAFLRSRDPPVGSVLRVRPRGQSADHEILHRVI